MPASGVPGHSQIRPSRCQRMICAACARCPSLTMARYARLADAVADVVGITAEVDAAAALHAQLAVAAVCARRQDGLAGHRLRIADSSSRRTTAESPSSPPTSQPPSSVGSMPPLPPPRPRPIAGRPRSRLPFAPSLQTRRPETPLLDMPLVRAAECVGNVRGVRTAGVITRACGRNLRTAAHAGSASPVATMKLCVSGRTGGWWRSLNAEWRQARPVRTPTRLRHSAQ